MGYTAGNIAVRTKAAKANAAAWNIDGFKINTSHGCTAIVAPAATLEDASIIVALVEVTHTIHFAKFSDSLQVVEITAIAGNQNVAVR